MNKAILFIVLTAIVTTYACKKSKDSDPDHPYGDDVITETVSDYSKLKVGNYWIYQRFEIDSAGTTVTPTTTYDSCYIEKDTTIRGAVYHKYVGPSRPYPYPYNVSLLKDSADCIVDNYGKSRFSLSNFSTPLYSYFNIEPVAPFDTVYSAALWMTEKNINTSVPAGTFLTINAQTRYKMFPPYNWGGTYRNLNKRFSKNVGIVSMTELFYASAPNYNEYRLVRYHVN